MVLEVQDDNFFCNVVVNNLLLNLTVNKLLLDLIVNNLLLDLILNDLLELVRKEALHWGWNEQLVGTFSPRTFIPSVLCTVDRTVCHLGYIKTGGMALCVAEP